MQEIQQLLSNIWFVLIGLMLMFYVVLDGFDLGVGMLSLLARRDDHHAVMMSSIGSVWGANETWLVLLAGSLFGAFPVAFGVVLHALYVPVMIMLLGLILRGVAFEFIEHAPRRGLWDLAFGLGSLLAALAQGCILGGLLGGLRVSGDAFAGGLWDWVSPFALLVTAGVVAGNALLGAAWLIFKTSGPTQRSAVRYARLCAYLTLLAAAGITVWTPIKFPYIAERWFSLPTFFWIAWLPALALVAFVMLQRALAQGYERAPFGWSLVIFIASLSGLAVSLYPVIVPPDLTLIEAAASAKTLAFMLPGIAMLIPIMLVYNGYLYVVFRGKVHADKDYGHH